MSKVWSGFALLGSTATLVCCVIPAAMVALGFGATLAAWVTVVPEITRLSEHKHYIFIAAGILLGLAFWIRSRPQAQTCPSEPELAKACERSRRFSNMVLRWASFLYLGSVFFAYILPIMMQ